MNFKNIKTRLIFWYSFTVFILLILFYFVFIFVFYKQELSLIDTKLLGVQNYIEHNIQKKYNSKFKDNFDDEEKDFKLKNLLIKVYNLKNNKFDLLTQSGKVLHNIKKIKLDKKKHIFITYSDKDDNSVEIRTLWFKTNKLKGKNIYVEVSTTIEDKIDKNIELLEESLIYLIPIITLLFILIGYIIINNAFKNVKKVVNEVSNIQIDDLQTRLSINNSGDEIEELIITFNNMLEKIQKSVNKIKHFSNDVSHELKTPITVIMGELELGLKNTKTIDEYKNILKISYKKTNELKSLINSLFYLSHLNDKSIKDNFINIDFDEILVNTISKNQHLLKEKNINIEFIYLQHTVYKGNLQLLSVMIDNIIQNAIKYSNNSSKIEICLKKNICTIKDYGIGIKQNELDKIFDRFYRTSQSRSKSGHGLGLAIVNSIAKIHNINISINSQYKKYTKFIIKL